MKKKINERQAKYNRILEANRGHVPTSKPNQFYALIDVRAESKDVDGTKITTNKTYVVGGSSRSDAEYNAETFMEVHGLKGRITGIYPVR
jgi:CRISPR/Cas system CSM-associated protein Csm2 small subunit